MTARRRVLAIAAVATVGAALAVPAASATTVHPSTEVTAQWLNDPVPFSLFTVMDTATTGTDPTGEVARTDASFGAWWIRMHGATFSAGSTGKILTHTGKVVTLGLPYTWPTVVTADGGVTSTTPKLGYLAVWGKSASIKYLNGDFSAGTAVPASATNGHVGIVTGVYSNGDAQVSDWETGGVTPNVVTGKETGLTYVQFTTSASNASATLTVKNSTRASITVSVALTSFAAQNASVARGATSSFTIPSFTNDLLPVSYTVYDGSRKVGSYTAVAGKTNALTIST